MSFQVFVLNSNGGLSKLAEPCDGFVGCRRLWRWLFECTEAFIVAFGQGEGGGWARWDGKPGIWPAYQEKRWTLSVDSAYALKKKTWWLGNSGTPLLPRSGNRLSRPLVPTFVSSAAFWQVPSLSSLSWWSDVQGAGLHPIVFAFPFAFWRP